MAKLLAQSTLGAPGDTYYYKLASSNAGVYATISSDDCLRLFDAETLSLTTLVRQCHDGIACLQTSDDGNSLITAGRDGKIQAFDSRGKKSSMTLTDRKC